MHKLLFTLLGTIFSIFLFPVYAQAPLYSISIQHSQHILARDPDYKNVFQQFNSNPKAEIHTYYTLNIKIYHEKENQYSATISFQEDSVTGNIFYKQLTLGDLFYPKRIFLNGNLNNKGKPFLYLKIQNQNIPENHILVDTLLFIADDTLIWNHKIEYFQFYFDDSLFNNIALRIKKIDAYYQNDSLFNFWNKELDKINLSNVDLLPIYKFTLDDIEKEANTYINNRFENLLSLSKIDNSVYLKKVSRLLNRINTIKNYLTATLPDMDEMLYRKGEEYENQNNYEKAVYYYQRTLDYNPTHAHASLALSNYYIQQKNYTKPIYLIANLYNDTFQVIEDHAVANNLYNILLHSAEEQIKKSDYYSALKILDTLENYCSLMPLHFCNSRYKILQKEAKQGIYNSYLDVIHQAIRNERYVLVVNYTQGLRNLMRKNKDTLETQLFYQKLMNELWTNFLQTMHQNIYNQKYIFALTETKEFNNALDSAKLSYPDSIFNDIYTICYTNLYEEKSAEIEKMKENKQTKILTEKLKEVELFYSSNQKYIQQTTKSGDQVDKTKIQQFFLYNHLCSYMNSSEINITDFSFLDSCILYTKWQQYYHFDTCINWFDIIENKCKPILYSEISRINTYIWGNEFKKAIPLYDHLSRSIYALSLQNDSLISPKFSETQSLIQIRGCLYLENDKIEQFKKARSFFSEKNYIESENILLAITTLPINCAYSVYDDSIRFLLKTSKEPAFFQNVYNQALENLNKHNYKDGFRLYEEAYSYFISNSIYKFGLTCLERKQFLIATKNENYYIFTCEEYINNEEFDKAMEIMIMAVSQHFSLDSTQKYLATNYLHYVKEKGYKPLDVIKPYSLSEDHIPFLNAFLGKFNTFIYLLIH